MPTRKMSHMLSVSTQIAKEDDLSVFARMLDSVRSADELIIFNMERKDSEAKKLFAKYQARVVNIKTPKVVEEIRERQIKESKSDWILVMDYDEVITAGLAKEIKKVVGSSNQKYGAYYITRRNYSLGYPLKHGGFGDDAVPRLFLKSNFVSWPTEIHGMPKTKAEFGNLTNPMEHHKDASLAQMVAKTNRYTDVEARQFFEGGVARVTQLTLLRKTIMEFIRRYFLKAGFLDGKIGIIQAIYQSYAIYLRYAKLYEYQKGKR